MKAMNVELDMYKQQVEEFRCDILDVVSNEEKIKQQWVASKTKQRAEEEDAYASQVARIHPNASTKSKAFTH